MSDTFAGTGVQSIAKPLRPKGTGWQELAVDHHQAISNGGPLRVFLHTSGLCVFSAVEYVRDTGQEAAQEYHLSMSLQTPAGPQRCDRNQARWILAQFNFDGGLEDNHVPSGRVRNFWRPVAAPLIGKVCECNDAEPTIVEDKGDFIWRGITR